MRLLNLQWIAPGLTLVALCNCIKGGLLQDAPTDPMDQDLLGASK